MLFFILVTIVLTTVSPSLQQTRQPLINSVADNLLRQVNLASSNKNFLLQDVSSSLPLHFGQVVLREGSVTFSQLSRASNVNLQLKPDGTMEVILDLHIGTIQANFKKYLIKAVGVTFNSGYFTADLTDNLVSVHLAFGHSICDVRIVNVNGVKLGDFDVHLNSSTTLPARVSKILLEDILKLFNSLIKDEVKRKVYEYLFSVSKDFQQHCVKSQPIKSNWMQHGSYYSYSW